MWCNRYLHYDIVGKITTEVSETLPHSNSESGTLVNRRCLMQGLHRSNAGIAKFLLHLTNIMPAAYLPP